MSKKFQALFALFVMSALKELIRAATGRAVTLESARNLEQMRIRLLTLVQEEVAGDD